MKKLIYLIVTIVVLGLIVSGCIPVVPPTEQSEIDTLPNRNTDRHVPTVFLTIQAAIDAADPGDTIIVADGIYTITGKILVDKEVTITGNVSHPENVIVQYSSTTDSLIFDMRASNATIQGIKTINGKSGFWFDQSAVTGCTISNCIVDYVREYGIYMKNGGSGHTIDSCTISNTGQTSAGAPAVLIENCLDVTFSNNTLSSISDKGVYVRVCNAGSIADRVEVTGNTISGCAYSCIQVYQSPYTYIYNNMISSTSDKGLNIIGPNASSQAARVVVEGNSISGCPWGGILLTHDRYTYIYNNTIFSTGDKGISIADGENVTSFAERIIVEGNNVSGTKYPGIQVAYAVPYTYIYNNTLSGCNYYGADTTGDWDYASIHVDANCENTVIDGNTVTDGINGIQIWSDNCTVTNNTIYNMGLTYADTKTTADGTYYNSGIIIGSNWLTNNFKPTGTTITDNDIYDNYWGLYVRDYATLSPSDSSVLSVTATCNGWGDNSGPSGPGGTGSGDTVSLNVDYNPWLGIDDAPEITSIIIDPLLLAARDTSTELEALFDSPTGGTANINWGDGHTTKGIVSMSNGIGTVTDSHIYTDAGVYTVALTIDNCYESDTMEFPQYVVVYDPTGGFVTGGGWIDSPLGAYTANLSLTGKATFGFVSKYKKGATVPTGNTEFQFKAGDLNFHSESYDWLVIAGSKAMYKGTGTINGIGEYKFMLSAIDADINENNSLGVDCFRIKIWNSTGVIYDNQTGDEDDAEPTTEIAGGQIVIHKK